MNAATLREPLRFRGAGLHTGSDASMEVRPAQPGTGFVFIVGDTRIPATAEFASESPLATVISRDGKKI